MRTDVVVVGTGLAGLVTAHEAAAAGKRVVMIDQEPAASFGGQAFWSFGGLFLIDSPEQRRLGIRDSRELARSDWFATAEFDANRDALAMQWADSFLDFAAGEARSWLRSHGIRFFPLVGHAERGNGKGTGNSVPRFHIVWGTGVGVVSPFTRAVRDAVAAGTTTVLMRHRFESLLTDNGTVVGVRGSVLAPDLAVRGEPTNRHVIGEFVIHADHVVIATGGSGGNEASVRANWNPRLGAPPTDLLLGIPPATDGSGLAAAEEAGARVVNRDRMWHYPEGLAHPDPVWPRHGVRLTPGPSSLWLDSHGTRLPHPCYPGFATLESLTHLRDGNHDHSWLIMTNTMFAKEMTLSGSQQNPDLTWKTITGVIDRALHGSAGLRNFVASSSDVVFADSVDALLQGMRAKDPGLDSNQVLASIGERDQYVDQPHLDPQLSEVATARNQRSERLFRVAPLHRLLDEDHWPLIAMRMRVMSRKSLGGIQTDLQSRALDEHGAPIAGLYAVGEAAGFGGGGIHGQRTLEGTFLSGCMFTGRVAGRTIGRS